MKRTITLSITLVAIVALLSLASSDSTVQARKQKRRTVDTGVITLGAAQVLRITVVNRGRTDSNVRFRKREYVLGPDQILHDAGTGDGFTQPVWLAPGEAASCDIQNTSFAVRGTAFMDYADDVDDYVVAQIIDTATGKLVTIINNDGDPMDDNNHGTH